MEDSLIDISIDVTAPQIESPECFKLRERIAASRRLENERHSMLEALLTENEKLKGSNLALQTELVSRDESHKKLIEENTNLKQEDGELKQDLERQHKHIEELLKTNEKMKEDNVSAKAELASKSEECQRVNTQKSRLEALEQLWKEGLASMNVAPFVLVLIDGNEHTFVDALCGKTTDGGAEAGLALRDEISTRIQSQYDCKIITNIYVDFEGLLASGKLPRTWNLSSLRKFFIGFTQVQTGFQVIDTGPGPHEATVKLKDMLDLFVNNVQCKHVYYGCGSDANSLSTLDDYRDNFILRSSITLIKSGEYKDPYIYLPFEILELPSLFKTLSSTVEEHHGRAEDVEISRNIPDHSLKRARLNSTRPRPMSRFRPKTATTLPVSTWALHEKIVLLNINDQRVDSVVETSDRQANESLTARTKNKKLCVYFHVVGQCFNNSCRFSHEPRLNSKELDILIARVRSSPCDRGSACRSKACMYGHVCPYTHCVKGDDCPFRLVHGIDKQAVKVWDPPTGSENIPPMLYNSPSPEQKYVTPATTEPEIDADPRHAGPMPSLFAPRNPNIPEKPAPTYVLSAELYNNHSFKAEQARSGPGSYLNHSPKVELATSDAEPQSNHSLKVEQATPGTEEPYKRYFTRRTEQATLDAELQHDHSLKVNQAALGAEPDDSHSLKVEQATPGAEEPYKRYFIRRIGA